MRTLTKLETRLLLEITRKHEDLGPVASRLVTGGVVTPEEKSQLQDAVITEYVEEESDQDGRPTLRGMQLDRLIGKLLPDG
jgi:hypothetical protein